MQCGIEEVRADPFLCYFELNKRYCTILSVSMTLHMSLEGKEVKNTQYLYYRFPQLSECLLYATLLL